MDLVQRNLAVIKNRVRLGLHGCVLKVPNGDTPSILRGVTVGTKTFDPATVNDYEFQLFKDNTESIRANVQFAESEGYLHVSDPDILERNSHRGINRKEAEENFSTIYPIVDEIKIGYLPVGVEKKYYLVTESCIHGSINFTVNELYFFLDGIFNKITLLPNKQLRINKAGGLLNFHSNNLYLWDTLLSKWINIQREQVINEQLTLNQNKIYNIDDQYVINKISLSITETYNGISNIELILNNNGNSESIATLTTVAPSDLEKDNTYEFFFSDESKNWSLEIKQTGTNTTGTCSIKIDYIGRQ